MSNHEHVATTTSLELPSVSEQDYFHEIGLETDELGRPLHPWRDQLPDLAEGNGPYWRWGPNYTVDPIVISRNDTPMILLVKRHDNGKWALPGGFIDTGELPVNAGLREMKEETNLTLTDTDPILCYQGPVLDERSRLHAWSDTTALLWHSPTASQVHGGDDADDAQWFRLRDVAQCKELHGSHASLIETAIREHGSRLEQLEYFGDSEDTDITTPSGGHMGYDRIIATLPTGKRLFVKHHDATRFTDSNRESHSRRYLRKEHHVYQSLRTQSVHIPSTVELIGDHTLLMDAYDQRDGWYWRAPSDPLLRRQYISETVTALASIEEATIPPFNEVQSSYHSIIDEGWGSYLDQRDQILCKLYGSSLGGSIALADALNTLFEQTTQTVPTLDSFAHFDIRQSNLAWHPNQGVRIVDWSWADAAPRGVDTTSFLIDLAKSGHDINEFRDFFNADYARTLIGFWLGHSIWPTPTADQTVRDHQISSAIATYTLLQKFSNTLSTK